jgi:hypothetical protein
MRPAPTIERIDAMADEKAIAELIAKQAIGEQLVRYCRAMDRCDHALGYSIFQEDAKVDYVGMFKGSGRGFVDYALDSHKAFLSHAHVLSNVLVELRGPDRAVSESYVTMTLRMKAEDGALRGMSTIGRYADHWEMRGGQWKIANRLFIVEFDDSWAVTDPMFQTLGKRYDTSDLSYGVFGGTAKAAE